MLLFIRKKIPLLFWILVGIIAIILTGSLLANWLVPYDPYALNSNMILASPSLAHPFGTDAYGRDIFSRVIIGSRTSIFAALVIIAVAGTIGIFLGMISGYYGGRIDAILMRITDIFLAFPEMILAIAVAGILGGGLFNAVLALLLTTWTQYARLARSLTIAIKQEPFIQAARISGCSNRRIIFIHILPNICGPLIVTATLNISTIMMGLAGLSFLGLGVKVPAAEWGSMISEGSNYLQIAPWVALAPSAVMVCVMMIFNLFGDQVRDLLDPKNVK